MKKIIKDPRVNKEKINEYKRRGWTLIDLKLSKRSIEEALKGLDQMRKSSIKTDYKFRRIYPNWF